MKILGLTTTLRATYSGQYWFDHLLAQDQKRSQRPDAGPAHSIATRFDDSLYQRLASELAQVVSFSGGITRHRSAFLRSHSLGQVCGRKTFGLGRQRDHRFGYRLHPRLLQIHSRRGAAYPAHSARPKHPVAGRPQSSSVPPAPRPKTLPPSVRAVATYRAVSPAASHSAVLRCCAQSPLPAKPDPPCHTS